jgi:hypothetical protein
MHTPALESETPKPDQRRWTGTWMRAALWHPLLCIPGAVFAWLLTLLPGDQDVGWTVWIVLLGAGIGLISTTVMIYRRSTRPAQGIGLFLVGVAGTAAGLAIGVIGLLAVVSETCHNSPKCF